MNNQIIIPQGRFAADDAALAAKRAALKAKLLSGDKISLKPGKGDAMQGGGSDSSISIPKGKLADDAAYENSVKIAKKLLRAGASIDLVVQGTELPREEVEAIAKRLGKLIA